jgi:hypothetical protein
MAARSKRASVGGGTVWFVTSLGAASAPPPRVLDAKYGGYTVGVLVQCNYDGASAKNCRVPVGKKFQTTCAQQRRRLDHRVEKGYRCPHPYQLKRRPGPRLPRSWAYCSYSGDLLGRYLYRLLNRQSGAATTKGVRDLKMPPNEQLNRCATVRPHGRGSHRHGRRDTMKGINDFEDRIAMTGCAKSEEVQPLAQ